MSERIPHHAKVENGIITDVRAVEWDYLLANPDRYGDSSLWIEVFQDGSERGYCGIGWTYDAENDVFKPPAVEVTE